MWYIPPANTVVYGQNHIRERQNVVPVGESSQDMI